MNKRVYRFGYSFIAGPTIGFEVYDANGVMAFVMHLLFFRVFFAPQETEQPDESDDE